MKKEKLFKGIYQNKTVLLTGHTGFVGSWLALVLNYLGAKVVGYSIDYPENSHYKLLNIPMKSIMGDINDVEKLKSVFQKYKPEIVFHLAAQSFVRESYKQPYLTYQTNVLGTLSVLENARKCKTVKCFINVTTDKVYENFERNKPYSEEDRLGGGDMYSSSKACSEILTSSYRRSFLGTNQFLLATVRAGNIIGGGDWGKDRLIPDLMKAYQTNRTVLIRNPNSIRPWQYVLDPIFGYLLLGERLLEKENKFVGSWNFGPPVEGCIKVIELLKQIKKICPELNFAIDSGLNKLHEAKTLKLNCTKSNTILNWKPVWDLRKSIEKTIQWYMEFIVNQKVISEDQLREYILDF